MRSRKRGANSSQFSRSELVESFLADNKKSLRDALEAIRRGKWLILSTILLIMGATLFHSLRLPPVYQAYSIVMVTSPVHEENDALSYGLISGSGGRDLSNQVLILQQSLAIAERTANRLQSLKTVHEEGEPISLLYYNGHPLPLEDVAVNVQRHVSIKRAEDKSNGILISVRGTHAAEAALIANLYAEEYVNLTHESSRQRITASRSFLEEQLDRRQEELIALEDEIGAYRSQQRALSLESEANFILTQSSSLITARDEALVDKSTRQALLTSLETELEELHPRLARRIASNVGQEIEQAQRKLAEIELVVEQIYLRNPSLRTNPGQSNEELNNLNTQKAQLTARISELSDQYVSEVMAVGGVELSNGRSGGDNYVAHLNRRIAEERLTLSGVDAKIATLEQRINQYDDRLRTIPGQAVELARLQRDQKAAEGLYNSLLGKLQEVHIAEQSHIGTAEIIRRALIPASPDTSKRNRLIVLGLFLSFALSFVAVLVRQRLDSRIYAPDDLGEKGIRLLGVVPDMADMIKTEFQRAKRVSIVDTLEIDVTLAAAYCSPASPIADSYRHLCFAIERSVDEARVKTIVVTSPEADAGKSTTAANLAITLATAGRRTIIIDADLRKPSISRLLGLSQPLGLETLLRKDHGPLEEECLFTGIDNLYAIAGSASVENPSKLIDSSSLRNLLDHLGDHFDTIIIDTPPLLAAVDAASLAIDADTTVMVVRAGHTHGEALLHAMEILQRVGAPCAGTILNCFESKRIFGYNHTYGYSGKYYQLSPGMPG